MRARFGAQRSAVSWRSVLIGLFGTILLCAVTPYNDYVLFNTFVIGNNLPLGALGIFFLVAIAVNGRVVREFTFAEFVKYNRKLKLHLNALPMDGKTGRVFDLNRGRGKGTDKAPIRLATNVVTLWFARSPMISRVVSRRKVWR